jgi:hypothetical protein
MLKGKKETTKDYASEAFKMLNDSMGKIRKTTETLSFRAPFGEKARLRLIYQRMGLSLADGLKMSVYDYLKSHDLT